MRSVLLFLDIDGVLHPDPASPAQAFSQRHLLWQLLLEQPALQVVISSDWRLRHPLPELAGMILQGGPGLHARFIGVTPELPGARHEYRGRERECLAWIETNPGFGQSWIAIDDVAGNFTFGSPQLFLTDHRTGLVEADLDRVRRILIKGDGSQ